jgi:hypothetical protein
VRKLKSMDWDRIRIFPEAARTGMRVNRQHMDVNRASMVHSLFPDFIGGPPNMITVRVCRQSVSSEIPAIILADTGSLKDSSATTKSG